MKRILSSLYHALIYTFVWSAFAAPLIGALYYVLLIFDVQSLLWLAIPAMIVLFVHQFISIYKDDRNFSDEKI